VEASNRWGVAPPPSRISDGGGIAAVAAMESALMALVP